MQFLRVLQNVLLLKRLFMKVRLVVWLVIEAQSRHRVGQDVGLDDILFVEVCSDHVDWVSEMKIFVRRITLLH